MKLAMVIVLAISTLVGCSAKPQDLQRLDSMPNIRYYVSGDSNGWCVWIWKRADHWYQDDSFLTSNLRGYWGTCGGTLPDTVSAAIDDYLHGSPKYWSYGEKIVYEN